MMVLHLALLFALIIQSNALRCHPVARSTSTNKFAFEKSFSLSASASETENGGMFSLTTAAQRKLSVLFLGGLLFVGSPAVPAFAIDPSSLKQYTLTPGAGIDPTQLKKYTEVQDALDAADIEYTMLKSGTSYREFREGRGTKTVAPGSIITTEMTIRCKSLSTQKDPGGVKYYDTKVDSPNKELTWVVGSGEFSPAVEEALLGMKRSAIRRVELPSMLVFRARADKQLPMPSEKNEDGNRYYKRLFKTDATLLLEVLVTKIVDPVPK